MGDKTGPAIKFAFLGIELAMIGMVSKLLQENMQCLQYIISVFQVVPDFTGKPKFCL